MLMMTTMMITMTIVSDDDDDDNCLIDDDDDCLRWKWQWRLSQMIREKGGAAVKLSQSNWVGRALATYLPTQVMMMMTKVAMVMLVTLVMRKRMANKSYLPAHSVQHPGDDDGNGYEKEGDQPERGSLKPGSSLHICHWCLFCQYLCGIYSVKVISTEKWCLEWRK